MPLFILEQPLPLTLHFHRAGKLMVQLELAQWARQGELAAGLLCLQGIGVGQWQLPASGALHIEGGGQFALGGGLHPGIGQGVSVQAGDLEASPGREAVCFQLADQYRVVQLKGIHS